MNTRELSGGRAGRRAQCSLQLTVETQGKPKILSLAVYPLCIRNHPDMSERVKQLSKAFQNNALLQVRGTSMFFANPQSASQKNHNHPSRNLLLSHQLKHIINLLQSELRDMWKQSIFARKIHTTLYRPPAFGRKQVSSYIHTINDTFTRNL